MEEKEEKRGESLYTKNENVNAIIKRTKYFLISLTIND